jgi:deoxyribonuclease V
MAPPSKVKPAFRPLLPHPWDLDPREAMELQKKLSSLIILQDDFDSIRLIAGTDLALSPDGKEAYAGMILYEFPSLQEVRRAWVKGPLTFPYIPGLLSFREGPILLKAFQKLDSLPDLILFDGQGIAHPRRLGIASHMGLLLNRPTIGCAKSLLCGRYEEPEPNRGSWSPLTDRGETLGAVLRTRDHVNPIFVSAGHRMSLTTAIRIVLQCHSGYRIPKPTREADLYVAEIKKQGGA